MIWSVTDCLMKNSGFARRELNGIWYRYVSRLIQNEPLVFLNYGYATLSADDERLDLEEQDEANRYTAQLYHHLASAIKMENLHVLEVGSGRGGGASFIKRYHRPATVLGIERATNAVEFCRQHYKIDGLSFKVGDAEDLDIDDESEDVVINVESSHCYSSMRSFVTEVHRVLKTNGYFLFTDLGTCERMSAIRSLFLETGFTIVREKPVEANVLRALDFQREERLGIVRRHTPWFVRALARDFSGVKGSPVYRGLEAGTTLYRSFVLLKS